MKQQEGNNSYYSLLGVKDSATPDQIKKAYKKACQLLHPDKNRDQDTTQIFLEVKLAYKTLSNPELRKQYDFALKSGGNPANFKLHLAEAVNKILQVSLQAQEEVNTLFTGMSFKSILKSTVHHLRKDAGEKLQQIQSKKTLAEAQLKKLEKTPDSVFYKELEKLNNQIQIGIRDTQTLLNVYDYLLQDIDRIDEPEPKKETKSWPKETEHSFSRFAGWTV